MYTKRLLQPLQLHKSKSKSPSIFIAGMIVTHVTPLHSEDKGSLNTLLEAVKTNYNERYEDIRKRWGGGIMGRKAQDARAKVEKIKMREMASKMSA